MFEIEDSVDLSDCMLSSNSVAYSPNASVIAVVCADGTIQTYSVDQYWGRGPALELKAAHQKEVSHLAFAPDGKLLVSSGDDGKLKVLGPLRQIIEGSPGVCRIVKSQLETTPDNLSILACGSTVMVK